MTLISTYRQALHELQPAPFLNANTVNFDRRTCSPTSQRLNVMIAPSAPTDHFTMQIVRFVAAHRDRGGTLSSALLRNSPESALS